MPQVLPKKIASVRRVNRIVTEPRRSLEHAGRESQRQPVELRMKSVFASTRYPFDAHAHRVVNEKRLVTTPHLDSRVIPPPAHRVSFMLADIAAESDQNLLRLNSLLAEPFCVDDFSRRTE
jgi:hypothetical protein